MNTNSTGSTPVITATEKERNLIVGTFKDNDALLKSLRALFLNLEINEEEKKTIRGLQPEVKRLIRDRFLPTLDKESPIGQVKDVWLGAEQMVFGQATHIIQQAIQYKAKALEITEVALELLDKDGEKIDLTVDSRNIDSLGVDLLARNQFIRHVESQLYALWVIANQNQETPAQLKARERKDSAE